MKKTILIADDNAMNRELLGAYLEGDYDIKMVEDGVQTIDYLKDNPDTLLLLLDLYMPNMTGFEVLEKIREMGLDKTLPVILISGDGSVEAEEKGFDLGATDFVHKPFEPAIVRKRVKNAAELYASRNYLEQKVTEQTESIRKQNGILREQARILKETNEKIIDVLGTTVEFRHMDSFEHINRVKAFTKCLGEQIAKDYSEFKLSKEDIERIVVASSLHDIGKIAISDSILLKPGKLTKEEFDEMKTHTTRGCTILDRVRGIWDDDFGKVCYDICRHHHERYDGKGYPDGLVGEDIPIAAQIVSVADVYDALVCKRVYKEAIPKDEACRMILEGECGCFSPKLLDAFGKCKDEFATLAEKII